LNLENKFSHTPYNFPTLIGVCEKLVRQSVIRRGGKIEKDAAGNEVFLLPIETAKPSRFEQCWEPGPVANSRFTEAEMKQITAGVGKDMKEPIGKFAPGWKVEACGEAMETGLFAELDGKKNVLVTHPLDEQTPCVLSKKVAIPGGKKTILSLTVGHDPRGDWELFVKADGKQIFRIPVSKDTAKETWMNAQVDLSVYGDKEINLQLINQPTGWSFEAARWAKIAIESK
jgi:hypothetical protein